MCLVMSLCFMGNLCFAETIVLKTGKKIKGKIIEKTNKYAKIDIADGITVTYFSDEIERIETDAPSEKAPLVQKDHAPALLPKARVSTEPPSASKSKEQVPAGEMSQGMAKKEGGFLGDTEDGIAFSFAQLYFRPPRGWRKQANVVHQTGVSFLYYTKNPDYPVSMIGVTRDSPGEGVRQAIDFSRKVREGLLRTVSGITIAEPQTVTIAGYAASTFDMTNKQKKLRTYWYQFLIDGNIISVQLMASSDSFEQDFTDFKAFAESMRLVRKKK